VENTNDPQRLTRLEQALAASEAENARLKASLAERDRSEQQLVHNALHDDLTGLPNRSSLKSKIATILTRRQESSEADRPNCSVLFIDLDGFKLANDSLGHLVGDELLIQVADRLKRSVRNHDIVSRLGGDEFCILLSEDSNPQDATSIAQRIFAELNAPLIYNAQQIFLTASIGIATASQAHRTPDDLIRDADSAMYAAKANGKAQYRVFEPSLHKSASDRLKLESRLYQAVAKSEIYVEFQPILEMQTGRICSFEAMARWHDSELGQVRPDQFIRVSEETGIIRELGMQVLAKAVRQVSLWRRRFPKAKDLDVHVNLSCRQVDDPLFVENAINMVDAAGLPLANLHLEITETSLLRNVRRAQDAMAELRAAGINFSLDDFGTGYSSLAYLHALPLTEIKVDGSFVRTMESDSRRAALVELIQSLAAKMGLKVVAEGIETRGQLEMIKQLDIEYGQGYLFGRPMSPTDAELLLGQDNPPVFA